MYAIGGDTSFISPTGVLEIYYAATDTWCSSEVALPGCPALVDMPTALSAAGAARGADGRIYVFGGQISGPNFQSLVQVYDPTTNTWAMGTSMPTARTTPAVTLAPDGRIFVIGGSTGPAASNVVEVYDPASDSWCSSAITIPTCSTPPPPLPLEQNSENGAATGTDGRIYIAGGYSGPGTDTDIPGFIQIYDPNTNAWTGGANLTGRVALAAARGNDGLIYAIGGSPDGGPFLSLVESYDRASDSWTPAPSLNTPRYTHGAAGLADGRIYVVGGFNDGGLVSSVECLATGNVPCTPPPEVCNGEDDDFDGLVDDGFPSLISAFRQPINDPANPMSVFKQGATVPVKFRLHHCDGSLFSDVEAEAVVQGGDAGLFVAAGIVDPNLVTTEASSSTQPDQGNDFRYSPTDDQFIFNWGTKSYGGSGQQYTLVAMVVDAGNNLSMHGVNVALK